jgi:hypothetical protein
MRAHRHHLSVAFLLLAACGVPTASPPKGSGIEGLDAANERARSKAREQLERGEKLDVSAESNAAISSIDAAASGATGAEAAVMKASAELLRSLQDASRRHDEAVQAFVDAGALDVSTMTPASLADRRAKLATVCSVNAELRHVLVGVPDDYVRRALAAGASQEIAEAARKGFLRTFPQAELLRMRALDAQFCEAAGTQLALLADRRGHWSTDAQGQLAFDETVSEADLTRFNEAGQAVQRVATQQEELQKKLYAK